jgi:hypothetical protein
VEKRLRGYVLQGQTVRPPANWASSQSSRKARWSDVSG